MNKFLTILLLVFLAGCSSQPQVVTNPPPMDPTRKISEQECAISIGTDGGNLKCREVSEAEMRARIAEEERQARARKEAAERAERERLARERAERDRLERERLEQIAAERRRLEAEAARKAQEERERQEKAAAELRARQLAEQQAREAAERECRRLEQEILDGRAQLSTFVATYGKVDEFKGIAGQINAFLERARKPKPCPPA
jgi:hypothetical protein